MLNSVIERLTSLFSRQLLIANFYPLFAFVLFNIVSLHWISGRVRGVLRSFNPDSTPWIVLLLLALVCMGAFALVLSALEPAIRFGLEGRGWPVSMFAEALRAKQRARLAKLSEGFEEIRELRRSITLRIPNWTRQLSEARGRGKDKAGAYCCRSKALRLVEQMLASGIPVRETDLSDCVDELVAALQSTDADAGGEDSRQLDEDHQSFLALATEARATLDHEYFRRGAELEGQFGKGGRIEATAIGNLAATTVAYASSRYGIDLDRFHGVFEKALREDAELAGRVDSIRTELSFLISCLVLSAVSAVLWGLLVIWRCFAVVLLFPESLPLMRVAWLFGLPLTLTFLFGLFRSLCG